jgi:hypothetical protein
VSVYCDSYNPTWSWFDGNAAASAIFTYADGTRFTFTGSWCAPGLETSWNSQWRASTPGGTAVWDGDIPPVAERVVAVGKIFLFAFCLAYGTHRSSPDRYRTRCVDSRKRLTQRQGRRVRRLPLSCAAGRLNP